MCSPVYSPVPGLLTPLIFTETNSTKSQVGCSSLAKQPDAAHWHHCWDTNLSEVWAAFSSWPRSVQEITTGLLLRSSRFLGKGRSMLHRWNSDNHSQNAHGFPCAVQYIYWSYCLDRSSVAEAQWLAPHRSVTRHKEVPTSILPATGFVRLCQPSHKQPCGLLQRLS